MTRHPDDHDFSDRGLDIRPPRPEETAYLEEMKERLAVEARRFEHDLRLLAESESSDPEDGEA